MSSTIDPLLRALLTALSAYWQRFSGSASEDEEERDPLYQAMLHRLDMDKPGFASRTFGSNG